MSKNKTNLFTIVPISKKNYAILIFLSSFSALLGALIPIMLKNVVDNISKGLNPKEFIFPVSILIFQTIFMGICNYLMRYIGNKSMLEVRDKIWAKLLSLPLDFFDKTSSGNLLSKFFNNVSVINIFLVSDFPTFFSKILIIIFSIMMLLFINIRFLVLVLLVLIFSAIIFTFLGRFSFSLSKNIQKKVALLTSKLDETINSIKQIKASQTEQLEQLEGYKYSKEIYSLSMKEGLIAAITDPIFSFIIFSAVFIVFTYSGVEVANDRMSIGSLIAAIFYMFQICTPLIGLSSTFVNYSKAQGAAVELVKILNHSEEKFDGKEVPLDSEYLIEFQNVNFGYESNKKVLDDVSFTIKTGVNALIGPSGSGKSTIFNLIERFYNISSGEIYFNKKSINSFNLYSWRLNIGFVPQDPILFNDTIRENILYGQKKSYTDKDIQLLLSKYRAFDFMFSNEYGLNYKVGVAGKKLSGGQKQLLGIARVLLNNRDIILLDEITASLDSSSEKIIKNLIYDLGKDKLIFIIAHRLTTIEDASNIIFLDKGKVTGTGDHTLLYSIHKKYKIFYDNQRLKQDKQ